MPCKTQLMHCFKSAAILSTDVAANLIAHECHTDVAISNTFGICSISSC